ncbi:MAG: thymidine phosphorylase [Bacilli bacterium]
MNILEIIDKKRKQEELSQLEINYVVEHFLDETIKDYQMSSLLMAICINGMTDDETLFLTEAMINSGEIIDLSSIEGIKVDKHSTGGVGDKTTIALAPLVAACGLKVAKMSGRGLGYTGGTIDKLESISGFKTNLSQAEFVKQVNQIGVAIASQTGNLVPADKKIYALRDVTGTTNSIPLIASSIMSKKIASGADKIVIDVKVGEGAFLKNIDDARRLAQLMIKIGKHFNREVLCVLTNMNQQLGYAIGNGLEVLECIDFLNGEGPADFSALVFYLAVSMVSLGKSISVEEAKKLVKEKIDNKDALNKFKEMIAYQGGNLDTLKVSTKSVSIKTTKTGFIRNIDTEKIGMLVKELGAGRNQIEDKIDASVGVIIKRKEGEYITENEEIMKVYVGDKNINISDFLNCVEIGMESAKTDDLILEVIG